MSSSLEVERLKRIRNKVGEAFAYAIQDGAKLAGKDYTVPGELILLSLAGLHEQVLKIFSNEIGRLEDGSCQLLQKYDSESMN